MIQQPCELFRLHTDVGLQLREFHLHPARLVGELQAYQAERLPGGMLRYGAPNGMHDDTVIALALAWQGVMAGSGASVTNYRTA